MKRPREFAFDPTKDARNISLRGIGFEQARSFEFETAIVATDDRADCRVISLRKANKREIRTYVSKTAELE